ncbi:unnamed protein product, partial [Prorocentrum cordatum]
MSTAAVQFSVHKGKGSKARVDDDHGPYPALQSGKGSHSPTLIDDYGVFTDDDLTEGGGHHPLVGQDPKAAASAAPSGLAVPATATPHSTLRRDPIIYDISDHAGGAPPIDAGAAAPGAPQAAPAVLPGGPPSAAAAAAPAAVPAEAAAPAVPRAAAQPPGPLTHEAAGAPLSPVSVAVAAASAAVTEPNLTATPVPAGGAPPTLGDIRDLTIGRCDTLQTSINTTAQSVHALQEQHNSLALRPHAVEVDRAQAMEAPISLIKEAAAEAASAQAHAIEMRMTQQISDLEAKPAAKMKEETHVRPAPRSPSEDSWSSWAPGRRGSSRASTSGAGSRTGPRADEFGSDPCEVWIVGFKGKCPKAVLLCTAASIVALHVPAHHRDQVVAVACNINATFSLQFPVEQQAKAFLDGFSAQPCAWSPGQPSRALRARNGPPPQSARNKNIAPGELWKGIRAHMEEKAIWRDTDQLGYNAHKGRIYELCSVVADLAGVFTPLRLPPDGPLSCPDSSGIVCGHSEAHSARASRPAGGCWVHLVGTRVFCAEFGAVFIQGAVFLFGVFDVGRLFFSPVFIDVALCGAAICQHLNQLPDTLRNTQVAELHALNMHPQRKAESAGAVSRTAAHRLALATPAIQAARIFLEESALSRESLPALRDRKWFDNSVAQDLIRNYDVLSLASAPAAALPGLHPREAPGGLWRRLRLLSGWPTMGHRSLGRLTAEGVQLERLAGEVASLAERQRESHGALGELRKGLAGEEAARLAQMREARGRWEEVLQELRDILREEKVLRDREAEELKVAQLTAMGALRIDLEDVRAEQQRLRHAGAAWQPGGPPPPQPPAAPGGVRPEMERNSLRLIADMGARLEEFTTRLEGTE